MNKNNDVPVVLFAFNRPKQLSKTLECLKDNGIHLLYVFIDGPRDKEDLDGIKEVNCIIDSIDWVKVIKKSRKANIGLSESIQSGLNEVFENSSTAIVIEDDVCVSPEFYDFMKKSLAVFEKDKRIAGITGLRYPFGRKNLDESNQDVFLAPRFSSWGWATWKDRWEKISFDRNGLLKKINEKNIDFQKGGQDLQSSFEAINKGTLSGCWDIYYYMNMLISSQFFIWPKFNMVENIDIGGGTHYSDEKPDWVLKWETAPQTINIRNGIQFDDKIYRDFLSFFKSNLTAERNMKPIMKANIKKALAKFGVDIKRIPKGVDLKDINPEEYSTTDGPMEVPCQKESYYYALNNYVREGDKVLDVGMGVGYGMNLLSIKAKEVHAVDVDKKAVEYCTKANLGKNPKVKKLSLYDGYNLPYKKDYFDVVTCIDVIEHVEDYDRFLDELLRVAKRAVIIATPNRRPEYTNPDGTPTNYWHLREWSYREFDKIIKSHVNKIEWTFLDGPWEGPFKISKKVSKDTLVLMPTMVKKVTK